jgi:putative FmdB family regulatory protein
MITLCEKCDQPFEIVESIKTYVGKGVCPSCGNTSTSRIFSSKIHFIGTKVEDAEYNPAFGQVVKNSRHRNALAKEKGLIEVGNESPTRMHEEAAKDRQRKREKNWEDV